MLKVSDEKLTKAPSIGGWLFLPAFGLIVSPFVILFQTIANFFYDANIQAIYAQYSAGEFALMDYPHGQLVILIAADMVVAIFFLIYVLFTCYSFFKKKRITRKLMIFYLALNVMIPSLGVCVVHYYFNVAIDTLPVGTVFKALLAFIIWFPYFVFSKRVKNTFVN